MPVAIFISYGTHGQCMKLFYFHYFKAILQ
jgi:hypothetical protein